MEQPKTKEDDARKPSSKEAADAPAPSTEVNVNVDAKPTTSEDS